MKEPLQQLRGLLLASFKHGEFSAEDLAVFYKQAQEVIEAQEPEQIPRLHVEYEKIQALLADKKNHAAPDLSSPILQLLWAAALAVDISTHQQSTPTGESRGHIQKILENHPMVDTYRKLFALEVSGYPGAKQIKLGWIKPSGLHVSHHFSPDQHFLGMDILYSLAMGLSADRLRTVDNKAHAGADILHEVAHGIGTNFTPKLQAIREQMEAIKKPSMAPDAYIKLAQLQMEWNIRFSLFDAAENNYANKFSANNANAVNAYDYSINCTQALYDASRGIQYSEPPSATDLLTNLRLAIDSSFFKNNQLFEASEENWRKRDIHPEWISMTDPKNPDKRIAGMAALHALMALCQELEEMQPKPRDKWLSSEAYQAKVKAFSEARNEIVDKIFDNFAAHLLPDLHEQVEEKIKQQLQNKQNPPGSQPADGTSNAEQQPGNTMNQEPPEVKNGNGSDGKPSDENDGKKSGEVNAGKNKDSNTDNKENGGKESDENGTKGNKDDAQTGEEGAEGKDQPEGNQPSKDGAGSGSDTASDSPESSAGAGNAPREQQVPSGEGKPATNTTLSAGKADGTTADADAPDYKVIQVEGVGDMPDIEVPPETPRLSIPEEKLENVKTVEELLDELSEEQQQAPYPATQTGEGQISGKPQTGLPPPDKPIRPADWNDYMHIVAANAATIKMVQKMRDEIQKRQVIKESQRTRTYDHAPEDGDATRFDTERYVDLVTKKITNQSIEENDMRLYIEDANDKRIPAPIDVYIILDISGSMKGRPYETAIHAATVAYEGFKAVKAGKNSLVNIHISTLGGQISPQFIAKPGDKYQDIGKRIAGARDAIGGGTDFRPALKMVIEKAANKNIATQQPVGQSYIFVVSDCVFTDSNQSIPALVQLSQLSQNVNVDFLKIPAESSQEKHEQKKFVNTIEQINKLPNAKNKMGITDINNINELPASMLGMLKQRLLSKDHLAKPYGLVQKELKQINGRM